MSKAESVVVPLSKEEQKEVRECFNYFDRDRDGRIALCDFGVCLRSLGALISESEIASISQSVTFPLSWEGFLPIATRKIRQGGDALDGEVLKAFQVFDVRGRGKVALSDLRRFLSSLGEPLSEEDLNDALRFAGIPHDQPELSYVDFLRTVKGNAVGTRR